MCGEVQYYPPRTSVFLYFVVVFVSDLSNVSTRKWQITINNPLDHGFTHEHIISLLSSIRGKSYYFCLCDEEGEECETLHTHVFMYRKSPFTAEYINSLFPQCHREKAYGTPLENRAYILKDGEKFHKDKDGHYSYTDSKGQLHIGINYSDTFYESGTCPEEHQGVNTSDEMVIDMVRLGRSNEEIIESVPSSFKHLDKIDRVRSIFRDEKFRNSWRDLHVVYIFGKTGVGKTRSVMEKHGYTNVYRVTDYKHPFDTYDGQDVILFEEFRSGLKHGDMLNYLDGYPLLLPCRYFDRQACYTKVYMISNLPPTDQYTGIDTETRNAFFRRIHEVIEYESSEKIVHYNSVFDYIHRSDWWIGLGGDDCPCVGRSEL